MNIVVVDIILTLVRSINVGFRILDEVAPFDATDIREFAPPNGRTGITNASVSRLSVEHILPDNTESIICVVRQATFGAAFSAFQKIVVGTARIREYHSQHGIGIAGVGTTVLVLALGSTQGE